MNELIMKNIQATFDKAAISLSVLCIIHCLALPLIIVLLPILTALNLEDEAVHWWMLSAVVPTSLYALTMGCKKHKDYSVMPFGIIGLVILVAVPFLGHDLLGESGESIFTTIGGLIIAGGHLINHRLCRRSDCQCNS
jgi:uncharacterized membrane protein